SHRYRYRKLSWPRRNPVRCRRWPICSCGLMTRPCPFTANVIVDFTDRTVQGLFYLQSSLDYQVKVTALNKATVTFSGISDSKIISGKIDRVTGDMSATSVSTEPEGLILLKTYALKCRPVQRMF